MNVHCVDSEASIKPVSKKSEGYSVNYLSPVTEQFTEPSDAKVVNLDPQEYKGMFNALLQGYTCTDYLDYLADKCHAHWDGGSSQGGTRHSLPPARRWGGFNFDDQLNSSTER